MVGGAIKLTSARYGSNSTVQLTEVHADTAADLGLSVATGTVGIDGPVPLMVWQHLVLPTYCGRN